MEAVDEMTAAELRTKLAEYGLPVMPITNSTRGVLVKKLKLLMAGQSDGVALAKYSSGEDSDLDAKEVRPKRKSMPPPAAARPRRSVLPQPPAPSPPLVEERPVQPVASSQVTKSVSSRRVTRTYRTNDDYETGSDSELDSATAVAPVSLRNPIKNPTIPSAASVSYSAADISDNLNSIRTRLGLAQPSERTYSRESEEIDSPYYNTFTRKLTALKVDGSSTLDGDRSNGKDSYATRTRYSYDRRAEYPSDFRTAGEKNVSKNNLVSLAIVGVGVAFFVAVSFVYMGMKSEAQFNPADPNNTIPVCLSKDDNSRPGENCVYESRITSATDLLKMLHPELTSRAVDSKCSAGTKLPYMTESETVRFVQSVYGGKSGVEISTDFNNAQVLVMNNLKWGISILSVQSKYGEQNVILENMDDVVSERRNSKVALAVLNPSVSMKCLIMQKVYVLSIVIVGVFLLILAAYLTHRGIRAYMQHRKAKQDEVYSFIEQIVEYLSQDNGDETSEGQSKAVAVNHIRDDLIPPKNRDKMSKTWNAAIKYMEENESRVRFEVEKIRGEEFQSIRWVSPSGSPKPTRSSTRSWQGQAFETQHGSVNNLAVSPTPCLKIRHMVDKNDKNANLKTVIRDAILEKCGTQCRILHIEIDKVSCCVFVKCASPADAGIVYQSLHGWWYEGSLITVKYLRLERYMDHFPSSPSVGPYLKPSNQ